MPDQVPDRACQHPSYRDQRCTVCGHACEHQMILNGACYECGSEDLDGLALSIKPTSELIPATRLVRGQTEEAPSQVAEPGDDRDDQRQGE